MTLILLAGLQSRPGDVLEAANVDGANSWQTFRCITMPHMRRYLELGGLLGSIYVVQTFDTVYVMTAGSLGTANLPYTVYETLYSAQDYGLASAQGVVVVIFSIAIATFLLRTVSTLFARRPDDHRTRPRPQQARRPAEEVQREGGRRLGSRRGNVIAGIAAWAIGILFVFPVFYMVLTSLHSEVNASTNPPSFFAPLTLQGYQEFFGASSGASPWPPLINSATASIVSTILVILLAIPAAYALAVRPIKKWTDAMFFFLSTKMLPAVAGLLPLYIFAKYLGLLDNINYLLILYTAMNLPIAVWMMRSFLADIPVELFEAAAMDGAGLIRTLAQHHRADHLSRDRGHRADLLHLRLERAAAGQHVDQRDRRHGAGVLDQLRHLAGSVPGQGVRGGDGSFAAGDHRRLRCTRQAGAGPVPRRSQVRRRVR